MGELWLVGIGCNKMPVIVICVAIDDSGVGLDGGTEVNHNNDNEG